MKRWPSQSPGKKSQGMPLWSGFLRPNPRPGLRPADSRPINHPSMYSRSPGCRLPIPITRGQCSNNRPMTTENRARPGNQRCQAGVSGNRSGHYICSLPVLAGTGRWRKNHVRPGSLGAYRWHRHPSGRLRPTIVYRAAVSEPTVLIPTPEHTPAITAQRPTWVREVTVAVGLAPMVIPVSSGREPESGSRMAG